MVPTWSPVTKSSIGYVSGSILLSFSDNGFLLMGMGYDEVLLLGKILVAMILLAAAVAHCGSAIAHVNKF